MAYGNMGSGWRVRIGRGTTPTWTELEGVGDLDLPSPELDEIEVTHQGSTAKEYIPGLPDYGSVDLPMNYVEGSPSDLLLTEMALSREMVQIEITPPHRVATAPAPSAIAYAGFLRKYTRNAPVGGKQTANVSFRINAVVA